MEILIANEIGSNLGHINLLLPLINKLSNHNITIALNNTKIYPSIQAPIFPNACLNMPLNSFADCLYSFGIILPKLKYHINNWKKVLDQIKPDLIIAEFSPFLGILSPKYKYITIGSGWSIPPNSICPSFTGQNSIPKDEEIISIINEIRKEEDLSPIEFLADLFPNPFITVYPALDVYSRKTPIGPLEDIVYNEYPRSGNFAYLYSIPNIQIDEGYIPNTLPKFSKKQDLKNILPHKEYVIHHGGISRSHLAIQTGTPQLLFPTNMEQLLNARNLVKLGVGAIYPNKIEKCHKVAAKELVKQIKPSRINEILSFIDSCS